MVPWAPLSLTGITTALLALPVMPALLELRKRRDAAPLPTSRHNGRIANFADAFHSRLEPLRPNLEECRVRHELSRISLDGMEVLLVGTDGFDFDPALTKGIEAVMCSHAARIPDGRIVDADVSADETLELGEGAALRAALGEGDIILGQNSVVLRWLHARARVYLRQGSSSYGRLSAGDSIHLQPDCAFERMHAPLIVTADADHKDCSSDSAPSCAYGVVSADSQSLQPDADAVRLHSDKVRVFQVAGQRIRTKGNFVLRAGETLKQNVIATGELRFGPGAHFFGAAKSYKDTFVGEDACVHGSIVSAGNVHLGPRSFVAGPIMAEGDVVMDRGSRVGAADALTTVSSSRVTIAAGCQLHGTVWARKQGHTRGHIRGQIEK